MHENGFRFVNCLNCPHGDLPPNEIRGRKDCVPHHTTITFYVFLATYNYIYTLMMKMVSKSLAKNHVAFAASERRRKCFTVLRTKEILSRAGLHPHAHR